MSAYRTNADPEPELAAFDSIGGPCPRCGEQDWQVATSASCPRNGLSQTIYCHIRQVHRHVICWRCDYQIVTESKKSYMDRKQLERRKKLRRLEDAVPWNALGQWICLVTSVAGVMVVIRYNGFHPIAYVATLGTIFASYCAGFLVGKRQGER